MLNLWMLFLPLALNVAAIRVPLSNEEQPATVVIPVSSKKYTKESAENPIFQADGNDTATDSYHVQSEELPESSRVNDPTQTDDIFIPARYLLPPRPDAEVSYGPTPETEEGDWTPMVQGLPKLENGPLYLHKFAETGEETNTPLKDSYGDAISISQNQELPKESYAQWFNPELVGEDDSTEKISATVEFEEREKPIITPPRELEPPLPDSVANTDFNSPLPASELQPPLLSTKPNVVFRKNLKKNKLKLKRILPTISLEMQPPTPEPTAYKKPTNLYPKKYSKINEYKPIPIPANEFHEGDIFEVPKAKPMKYLKPVLDVENDYVNDDDEKKIIKFQQAEEKRKYKENEDTKKQQEFVDAKVEEAFAGPDSNNPEQEASETGFYGNGRNVYAAPQQQAPPVAAQAPAEALAPAERTEFRMHGLQGPHSYKFGYDTGKGKNRQFRYEERNNDGYVKGHYGYTDKNGKIQVVNYDAHPEHGFHAEGPFGKV